jgi:hypothetical protein
MSISTASKQRVEKTASASAPASALCKQRVKKTASEHEHIHTWVRNSDRQKEGFR